MNVTWRLRVLAGSLFLLVAGVGCNPLTLPFFVMFGVEPKSEPEFRLATPDHEVTVLILAYTAPDVQTDQLGVDRQLGTIVARQLRERCQANKEKVKVVDVYKV